MHDHESEAVAIQEPEQLEALDDIAAEAERMSRLVNDMLTLARADAGQQLTRIPVNLRAPIEEVYRHARRLRDERNPAIKMELEADDDITVLGDPDALRQLFLILIDNAVKYTPGAGQVDIRLTREGNQAVLRVSDTGIGISAEDLPYIFERFYRADRARGQGGTGLGLAIAKWIAEEHGGSLSATSKPNEGSTFTLVLPAQPA
jgi:signal transduction histidine kinase